MDIHTLNEALIKQKLVLYIVYDLCDVRLALEIEYRRVCSLYSAIVYPSFPRYSLFIYPSFILLLYNIYFSLLCYHILTYYYWCNTFISDY